MEIGTVFQMIFTIILISALLIFGITIISQWLEMQEVAQIEKAKDDLSTASLNLWLTHTGSAVNFTIAIPASAKFCFVNPDDPSPHISGDWNPNEIVQGMIINNGYNLWYFHGNVQYGNVINHLNVSDNFCANNGDRLRLENLGTWVEASLKE